MGRVVEDDGLTVTAWVAPGSPTLELQLPDGRLLREVPRMEVPSVPTHGFASLVRGTWSGNGVLMQFPLSQPWSVWWFFHADGRFDGWYGNLESPKARWELPDGTCGLDTADRELDIEIEIDLTWSWKDEEPFVARAGSPGYWTTHQVDEIRADGYRLIAMVQDRLPPFDGRFTAFRVDPEWPLPDLPCLRQHPHRAGP